MFLISSVGMAQTETLFSGDIESGGYGAIGVKFGEVKGENGVFVGGQGAWVINHNFALGIAGYGFANDLYLDENDSLDLDFGYGGLLLEYNLAPNKLIHLNFQSIIGVGSNTYGNTDDDNDDGKSDTFFVIEPGINAVINIHENIRFSAGVSYRFVSGVDLKGLSNEDFSGMTAQITMSFGAF